MRTTVILPDELYRSARARAIAEGRTFTSLIEDALRRELARRDAATSLEPYRVAPTGRGGTLAGVDLTDSAALAEIMDDDRPTEKSPEPR